MPQNAVSANKNTHRSACRTGYLTIKARKRLLDASTEYTLDPPNKKPDANLKASGGNKYRSAKMRTPPSLF
jgi:hypothetical protein